MSKVDIFMPLYIGDYLKDTTRLTAELHGSYLLLMMDYWVNGPLPTDASSLALISKMSPDAWSNASSTILAFFELKGGNYHHYRIDKEIRNAKDRKKRLSARGKAAAEKRWDKKKDATSNANSNATSNQQAMLEECPSPSCNKDICDEFLKRFNEVTGKHFRVINGMTHRNMKARLCEEFTVDDFIEATRNAFADEYHQKHPKYLTPEFITRGDKLQTYLNAGVKPEGNTGSVML